MLADQGASVIVVKASKNQQKNLFAPLDVLSRGKSDIVLNLKKDRDRAFLLQDIIPHIDLILESYRPGVMEKLGLSPNVVHDINPNVIFLRMSGYG